MQVLAERRATSPDRVIEAQISLTEVFNCDTGPISQLISNLVANALAYGNPDAPIQVRAGVFEDVFEIFVSNTGDPIPQVALEHLFEPFFGP